MRHKLVKLLALMAGVGACETTYDYMATYTEYDDTACGDEVCDDGIDNDCDELIDEEDPDCKEEE